jgi:DNA-binding response OmpR family regulator
MPPSVVASTLQLSSAVRVLVVDDYPGLVELLDLGLGARGIEVVGAATTAEAMTRAVDERFDAVVIDLQLPDGSGVDLVDRLRPMPSLAAASFVGMSSFSAGRLRERFDAFLRKPFHPRRLASLLHRLVGRGGSHASHAP